MNQTSVNANGVIVTVKDNGIVIGNLNFGNLPAGYTWQCETQLTGYVGGSHTIEFVANENRSIAENNYNNNTAKGTFNYVGFPYEADIEVRNISSKLGSSFACRQSNTFYVDVVNYGPTVASADITFGITGSYGDSGGSSYTVHDLQPGYGLTLGFAVDILRAETNYIEFRAVPNRMFPDPNSSNDYITMTVTTTMDADLFPGKWNNAKNLNVSVYKSAKDLFGGTEAAMTNAIKAWNNITPNVSIGSVTYHANNNGDVGNITVSTFNRPGDIFTNVTYAEARHFKGNPIVAVEYPLTDSSNYTYAMVLLNADSYTYMISVYFVEKADSLQL